MPSAARLLLIATHSLIIFLSSSAPESFARSEPARSTRLSFERSVRIERRARRREAVAEEPPEESVAPASDSSVGTMPSSVAAVSASSSASAASASPASQASSSSTGTCCSSTSVKTACDRLEAAFILVAAVARWPLPRLMRSMTSCGERMACSVNPETKTPSCAEVRMRSSGADLTSAVPPPPPLPLAPGSARRSIRVSL